MVDNTKTYRPRPINTTNIQLSADLRELTEKLAKNTHDNWARLRLREGWTYGPIRDEEKKTHPDLVAYKDLPESEKEYDRVTALETLKVIISLGYRIEKCT